MKNIIINFFSTFEPAQWAVVISALLGAVVSIVLAIKNSRDQAKWNKRKIDADLKAKARIDWIQSVREHTAELFAVYYGILMETNKDNLLDKMQEAKKHSDILILYFGDLNRTGKKNDNNILDDHSTNTGKNERMVECISELFERINQYYNDVQNNKLGSLEQSYKAAKSAMYNFPISEEFHGVSVDEDGEEYPIFQPIFDPELESDAKKAEKQLNDYRKSIREIHGLINKLRDHMRLYLKIEWDIAKDGK